MTGYPNSITDSVWNLERGEPGWVVARVTLEKHPSFEESSK